MRQSHIGVSNQVNSKTNPTQKDTKCTPPADQSHRKKRPSMTTKAPKRKDQIQSTITTTHVTIVNNQVNIKIAINVQTVEGELIG